MRIQSIHFEAYTIILIYNINPDGVELTWGVNSTGVNMDHFSKSRDE